MFLRNIYFIIVITAMLSLTSCSSGDGTEPFASNESSWQEVLSLPQTKTLIDNKWCTYLDGNHPDSDYIGFLRITFLSDKANIIERYDVWEGKPAGKQFEEDAKSYWDFDGVELTMYINEKSSTKLNIDFSTSEDRHIMNTFDNKIKTKSHMWECNSGVNDVIPTGFEPVLKEDSGGFVPGDDDEDEEEEEEEGEETPSETKEDES